MRPLRQIALTMAVSLGCVGGLLAQDRVAWASSWAEAQALARAQQRLVLIHFWSQSCPPCLKLERTVYTRPEVVRALHMNYVPLKVNATEDPDTARAYSVQRWPTDVVVTPDGVEVHRGPCPLEPDHYIAMLDQVAAHARAGMPVTGTASTPAAPPFAISQLSRDSAFSAGNPLGYGGSAGPSSPVPDAAPSLVANPYAATGWQASAAEVAGAAATYGGQFQLPSAAGNAAAPSSLMPNANAAAPNVSPPGPADPRPGLPGSLPSPGLAAPPGGAGPPALDGYCPVSLAEREKWVKGDVRWGVHHRGRTYLFAGPEEQERFLAARGKFAPALSCFDPVKYVEQGALVDGKRGHGVFYRDQVFLFADEESLRRFWESPHRYVPVIEAEQIRSAAQPTNPPR